MKANEELFHKQNLEKRNLIFQGRHLPYNPELKERARQLRKNMTPAERKLWKELLRGFPHHVYRQRPIDNFIADFYCPALRLVIELDGRQHETNQGLVSDSERSDILNGWGLSVVRFENEYVLNNFSQVCDTINKFNNGK